MSNDRDNSANDEIKQVTPSEPEEKETVPADTAKPLPPRRGKDFERNDRPFNYWWLALYCAVIALFAVLGAYMGVFIANINILDVEEEVTNYQQKITTRILDGSGDVTLGELAEEKRVLISYDDINPLFINALISVEDKDFLNHQGVDLMGIGRAFVTNLVEGRVVQGGSTITQQLIKNIFLDPSQTYTRKIKEAVLAMQLEAKYTKEEILAFYCNTIYFGHQRYGLEAAARYYFGVSAKELDLNQAATLAGLIRAPAHYTPVRHMDRAERRRNHVLGRMVANGVISAERAAEARKQPIRLFDRASRQRVGEYPIEEARRFMVDEFGQTETLTGGYTVHTTINLEMQKAAEAALQRGLLTLSMRQQLRPAAENVFMDDPEIELDDVWFGEWERPVAVGDFLPALVTKVENRRVGVRIGQAELEITGNNIPSRMLTAQARGQLTRHFEVGDVFPVRIDEIKTAEPEADAGEAAEGEQAGEPEAALPIVTDITLSQEPVAEAALVAMEAQTGRVLAMVGGYNYGKSQWNNATQASRQTGSAFKPFVMTAALEHNRATLASTIFDEPTVFDDPQAPEIYEPANYKHKYVGITTVRDIIEHSRNIPAIKLMLHTGIRETIEVARAAGIAKNFPPVYSLALGSIEVPLIDMVGAYSIFPNQGVSVKPYLIDRIVDTRGADIYTAQSRPNTAIGADTAFLATQALIGVFENGTAAGALDLMLESGLPLAGKTGTTDDYTDAWFIGFSPQIVCGVWVGNEEKVSLGNDESGAVAALPIWKEFMATALQDPRYRTIRTYEIPSNVIAVEIDRRNGKLASSYTPESERLIEFFRRGSEPATMTSYDDDYNLRISPIRLMEKRVTIKFENDERVIPREIYDDDIF